MIKQIHAQLKDEQLNKACSIILKKLNKPGLFKSASLVLSGFDYDNVVLLNINNDMTWNISFNQLSGIRINDLNDLKVNEAIEIFVSICNSKY